ncbi:hypothetical protein CLOP_g10984 [Closterium sp. NIES-67]|nr:hypothetical protein CLOP_g10984 [Closterium sp. NIES-67]
MATARVGACEIATDRSEANADEADGALPLPEVHVAAEGDSFPSKTSDRDDNGGSGESDSVGGEGREVGVTAEGGSERTEEGGTAMGGSERTEEGRTPALDELRARVGRRMAKKIKKNVAAGKGTMKDYYDVYGPEARAEVVLRPLASRGQDKQPKPLSFIDVQDLILWVLTGEVNPQWVFLKNKPLVSRVVLLVVPGIDSHTFHSRKDLFPNLHRCFGGKSLPLKAVSPSATVSDTLKALFSRPISAPKKCASSSPATSASTKGKAAAGVKLGGSDKARQQGTRREQKEGEGKRKNEEEEEEIGEEEKEEGEVAECESEGGGGEGEEGEVGMEKKGQEGRDRREGGRKRKAEALGEGGAGEGIEGDGDGRKSKAMKISREGEKGLCAEEDTRHTVAPVLPSSSLPLSSTFSPSSPSSSIPFKSKPPLLPERYLLTWRQLKENNFPLPVTEGKREQEENAGKDGQAHAHAKGGASMGGGVSLTDGSAVPPPGYVMTRPKGRLKRGKEAGKKAKEGQSEYHRMVAVDCEMCNTHRGLELTRLTLLDAHGKVLLDELVKPDNPITNYNTQFSGITPQMLANVTTTLQQAQEHFLNIVSAETILVGHSAESDLHAIRAVHLRVIDTSLLFPHPRGPPFKCALRFLAADYLGRTIQAGWGRGNGVGRGDFTAASGAANVGAANGGAAAAADGVAVGSMVGNAAGAPAGYRRGNTWCRNGSDLQNAAAPATTRAPQAAPAAAAAAAASEAVGADGAGAQAAQAAQAAVTAVAASEADSVGHDSIEDARAALDLALLKIQHGPHFGLPRRSSKLPVENILTRLSTSGRHCTVVLHSERAKADLFLGGNANSTSEILCLKHGDLGKVASREVRGGILRCS